MVEPLIPTLKLDTKGLRTEEEKAAARKRTNLQAMYNVPLIGNAATNKTNASQTNNGPSNGVGQPNSVEQLTQFTNQSIVHGKHPVTVLQEVCRKRKWNQPVYSIVSEDGPPHKPHFLMKCTLNQVDYIPSFSSPNKKLSKALAAVVCLQAFGLIDCNATT